MWAPKVVRFFRSVYRDNRLRHEDPRNPTRDLALYARNRLLQPLEAWTLRRQPRSRAPVFFIVGCPRSGTTLLHQLMARHLDLGYITNRIARYWMAPVWASSRFFPHTRRQRDLSLDSDLGRALGEDAPHEFGWFWHFHLEPESTDELPDDARSRRRIRDLGRELQALAELHGSGITLKNPVHVPLNVDLLAAGLRSARFLVIDRDPRFVAQSLLLARKKRYGDESVWLSIRPRGWEGTLEHEPLEQVAFQVRAVSEALDRAQLALPSGRTLRLGYEELVGDTSDTMRRVAEFTGVEMVEVDSLDRLRLTPRNDVRIGRERFDRLASLLETA